MCTVVVSVAPGAEWPVVFLGLRDESADRPWDPPAAWWPELGDRVEGLHDREAGGAWLATATGPARASVVLNRREQPPVPEGGWRTRG
ncbi:NRDE family protein, partial [uncultured Frigoribacterium sp.]